jgi:hypothetical protein
MLGPDDVEVFRRIRLEALRADPAAYASRAEDWEALPDAEWRRRMTDCQTALKIDPLSACNIDPLRSVS